ncbi:MAG: NTP transferase domain-containing protein [Acidobacteria bacterium]|nr:NTP transferase domain-containing protein [Acidobacteriota bacterium]
MMRGALLVGGMSTRMGVRKHTLKLQNGTTLGEHLYDLLTQAFGTQPLLLGDLADDCDWVEGPIVHDDHRASGPIAGINAALSLGYGPLLVLAVDMPYMTLETLLWIKEQNKTLSKPVLWPRLPGRAFGEPLAGIYTLSAQTIMDLAIRNDIFALHQAVPVESRSEPDVPASLIPQFQNVNTRDEWFNFTEVACRN